VARFPFPLPRPSYPRRPARRRVGLIGAIALLIAAIAGGLQHCQAPATNTAQQTGSQQQRSQQTAAPKADARLAPSERPPERYEVLDGVAITDREQVRGIWDTLRRVARGPPFPHRQDGVPFQNRENRLPSRDKGWWREFTVETPGASDRGARRLVVGSDGEVWYSADHYRTFARLLLP